MTEVLRTLEPDVKKFLLATLRRLDDVDTDDERFWARVLGVFDSLEPAVRRRDPVQVLTAARLLDRVSASRVVAVGSRPTYPMPRSVRDRRTVLLHTLGITVPTPRGDRPGPGGQSGPGGGPVDEER